MSLSDRDRRILWGRSGNRCSYRFKDEICGVLLVFEEEGRLVNIGEECHIVGEKDGTARYVDNFPERDAYSNRILLCRNHHKTIDDDEGLYTVELLGRMKLEHERAIQNAVGSGEIEPIVIQDAQFTTIVDGARRAVGMEVNRPARISNVKSELRVKNTDEAIGFSTNQGLSVFTVMCSCNHPFSVSFTGTPPPRIECPHCGRSHSTSR